MELTISHLTEDLVLPGSQLIHFDVDVDLGIVVLPFDVVRGSFVLVSPEIFLLGFVAPLLVLVQLEGVLIICGVSVTLVS